MLLKYMASRMGIFPNIRKCESLGVFFLLLICWLRGLPKKNLSILRKFSLLAFVTVGSNDQLMFLSQQLTTKTRSSRVSFVNITFCKGSPLSFHHKNVILNVHPSQCENIWGLESPFLWPNTWDDRSFSMLPKVLGIVFHAQQSLPEHVSQQVGPGLDGHHLRLMCAKMSCRMTVPISPIS